MLQTRSLVTIVIFLCSCGCSGPGLERADPVAPDCFPQVAFIAQEQGEAQDVVICDIPQVASLDQLRSLPALTTLDGWELRIALAEPGEAAAGWKLIYCHRIRPRPPQTPSKPKAELLFGDVKTLGPLQYQVRPHGVPVIITGAMQSTYMLPDVDPARQQAALEELYCGTLTPTAHGARLEVGIPPTVDSEHTRMIVIARASLPPFKGQYVWQAMLHDTLIRGGNQGRPPRENLLPACLQRPAVPFQVERMPLWARGPLTPASPLSPASLPGQTPPPGGYQSRYLLGDPLPPLRLPWPATQPAPAPAPAPGSAPSASAPPAATAFAAPIRLALDKDHFVLNSPGEVDFLDAPCCLLARWWVNGRAVQAPPEKNPPVLITVLTQAQVAAEAQTKAQPADQDARPGTLRIPACLPPFLGRLASGDVIRLQVLYCPGGFERLRPLDWTTRDYPAYSFVYPSFGPVLSNPIEFPATRALISAGRKLAREQEQKKRPE